MTASLLLTLLVVGEASTPPNEPASRQRANELYRSGVEAHKDAAAAREWFRQSADAYESLWRSGCRNPHVARHLAQAYLLSGDLPQAIRAYHLGLRLAPHDKDLQTGLAHARAQVPYPVSGNLAEACRPRERHSLLQAAAADWFRAIAAAGYLFAMLAFARAWMTRRLAWWTTGGLLLVGAAGLASWVWWEERQLAEQDRLPLAIVAENGTPLRRGNGAEFSLRLNEKLPAGVEVRVLAERGGWLQVQLAEGEIGWVDGAQVVEAK